MCCFFYFRIRRKLYNLAVRNHSTMFSFSRPRRIYALLVVFTIIAGLLSRRTNLLPAATGDALYAAMMYFIIRFCTVYAATKAAIIALCICWAVEFSQLYQADWINGIRSTLPGRLILGRGFLPGDLLAYAAGVLAALLADSFLPVRNRRSG